MTTYFLKRHSLLKSHFGLMKNLQHKPISAICMCLEPYKCFVKTDDIF